MVSTLPLASEVVGLVSWRIVYAAETETLVDSAAAQDAVSVGLGVVLFVVAAVAVRTGSLVATLAWIGLLTFVAYNAAIYCFSVHSGTLFLVWTALLGLSVFEAVVTAGTVDRAALNPLLALRASRILAWVLIAAAVTFAVLWLKEIVPDVLVGRPSNSAAEWQVPTNPVRVLDLALCLPAVMSGGILILRGNPSWATPRSAGAGVADPHLPADPAPRSWRDSVGTQPPSPRCPR